MESYLLLCLAPLAHHNFLYLRISRQFELILDLETAEIS